MSCLQSIAPMNRVKLREPTQISKWQSEDSIQFHLAAKPIFFYFYFLHFPVPLHYTMTIIKHLEKI